MGRKTDKKLVQGLQVHGFEVHVARKARAQDKRIIKSRNLCYSLNQQNTNVHINHILMNQFIKSINQFFSKC